MKQPDPGSVLLLLGAWQGFSGTVNASTAVAPSPWQLRSECSLPRMAAAQLEGTDADLLQAGQGSLSSVGVNSVLPTNL